MPDEVTSRSCTPGAWRPAPAASRAPAYAPPMPSSTVWVGGQQVDDASISPLDHGYLVGDGVFETLKTIDGTPFALTRHLARLRRSATGLDLLVPDDATIREAIDGVLEDGRSHSGGCASRCPAAPGRSARAGRPTGNPGRRPHRSDTVAARRPPRHRRVAAERAWRDRGAEDHQLRRERRRPAGGPRRRRRRGPLRRHPRACVRRHRLERLLLRQRPPGHAVPGHRLPGRRDPRAGDGARRRDGGRRSRRAAGRRRGGVHHEPTGACCPCRTSTGTPSPPAPDPAHGRPWRRWPACRRGPSTPERWSTPFGGGGSTRSEALHGGEEPGNVFVGHVAHDTGPHHTAGGHEPERLDRAEGVVVAAPHRVRSPARARATSSGVRPSTVKATVGTRSTRSAPQTVTPRNGDEPVEERWNTAASAAAIAAMPSSRRNRAAAVTPTSASKLGINQRGAGRPRRRRPHHGAADLAAPSTIGPSESAGPTSPTLAGIPAATNSSRPVIPLEQQLDDLQATFAAPGTSPRHADPEFRARDAEEIMLRKNFKATGGTIAADRPLALDLLGVASQLVFNTFNNGHLLRLERSGDLDLAYGAARAHNRGMVEFCSVDPGCCPPATCRWPTSTDRRRWPPRPSRMGAAALLVPDGLPQRPLPQPHRPRPGVGAGRGGRHPDRAARRRRRAAAAPEVLRERRRLRPRLPRRRRELPLRRLHGHPRPTRPDAGHHDLRRRARAAPAPEDRRDRAGRHLGAGLDAADGDAPSTPSSATSSGCRT